MESQIDEASKQRRDSLGLPGVDAFWQGNVVRDVIVVAATFDRIGNFSPAE